MIQDTQVFFDFQKATITEKGDPEFGKRIALELLEKTKGVAGTYFYDRDYEIARNMQFAQGRQDMSKYLGLLGIDGKQSYVNLDMDPPDIASPFIERIVSRVMEREERPTVRCVDEMSLHEKRMRKAEAEWRMRMQEEIQARGQEAGVPMEDPSGFVPENQEDLDLWSDLEDKLTEEIEFEKRIYDVLMDSGYKVFKRRVCNDLVNAGFAVAKVYRDGNRNIKYRFAAPETMLYSYSNFDDFRDSYIIGERLKMKVSEFRCLYPKVSEDVVWKVYKASRQGGVTDSISTTDYPWDDAYRYTLCRPYDDAIVELFSFEYITADNQSYVHKRDNYGRDIVEDGDRVKGDGELIVKRTKVVYEGCYAIGAGEMVSWGVMENMIKPQEALHEAFTSWVIVMPNQNRMIVKSLTGRMISHIKQMTISLLKLQQLKGQMLPDETNIDYTRLQDIDLGLGRAMEPFDIMAIRQQTGVLFYKGTNDDGDAIAGPPITPGQMSSIPQKMMALMQDYNFHLGLLREDIGSNPQADGQGINSKTLVGVQENQIEISNRSTEFVYEGYITLLEGVAKRIAVMMWQDVMYGGPHAKGMDVEGAGNRVFDLQIDMLPTAQDRQLVDQLVQVAIQAEAIDLAEAFKVRRIAKINVKQAEILLAKYKRRKQEQAMQENQANIQATAEAQQASNQQTHDNAVALEQQKGFFKIKAQEAANVGGQNQQLGAIVQAMLSTPGAMQAAGPAGVALLNAYTQNLLGGQQTQIMANQITQQDIVKTQQEKAEAEFQQQQQQDEAEAAQTQEQ